MDIGPTMSTMARAGCYTQMVRITSGIGKTIRKMEVANSSELIKPSTMANGKAMSSMALARNNGTMVTSKASTIMDSDMVAANLLCSMAQATKACSAITRWRAKVNTRGPMEAVTLETSLTIKCTATACSFMATTASTRANSSMTRKRGTVS